MQRRDRDLHAVHLRPSAHKAHLWVIVLFSELGEHCRPEVLNMSVVGNKTLFILGFFNFPVLFKLLH